MTEYEECTCDKAVEWLCNCPNCKAIHIGCKKCSWEIIIRIKH